MYGYIYKIFTSASNKVYIGQTTKTVEERYQLHLGARNSKSKKTLHLYLAMNKYGIETFAVEQIDTAETREELNEKEKYWINYYDSINNGYNMMPGGNEENPMNSNIVKEKHDNKMRSKEVREKISKTLSKFRLANGFTEEHKRKIKEARKKRKEERKKIGLTFYDHPEKCATRSRAVYCILENGERHDFKSIREATIWWFNNFHPFGDTYVECTLQRKIKVSASGGQISCIMFDCLNKQSLCKVAYRKVITNIKWYFK